MNCRILSTIALILSFFPSFVWAQQIEIEEVVECFGTADECELAIQTYVLQNPNGGLQDSVTVGGTTSVVTVDLGGDELDDETEQVAPTTTSRTLEGAFGLNLTVGGASVGSDGLFLLTPGIWGEVDGNGPWSFQFQGGVGFARAFERNWYAPTTWMGANRRWESNSFAVGGRITYVRSAEADHVIVGAFEPRFRHWFSESFGIGAYAQFGASVVNVETTERRPGTSVDVYGEGLESYAGDDDVTIITIDDELRPFFGGGFELFVEF